jgi:hypothetical protein
MSSPFFSHLLRRLARLDFDPPAAKLWENEALRVVAIAVSREAMGFEECRFFGLLGETGVKQKIFVSSQNQEQESALGWTLRSTAEVVRQRRKGLGGAGASSLHFRIGGTAMFARQSERRLPMGLSGAVTAIMAMASFGFLGAVILGAF